MKAKRFTIVLLLICFFMAVSLGYAAEKVKVVEGIIQNVTVDSIEVRNKYYSISDVPLRDASGRTLTKDYLKPGKKVEIYFQGNKITTILIHEYMVE